MSYKIALTISNITDSEITFKLPSEMAFKNRLLKYIGDNKTMVLDFARLRKRRSVGDGSQNHHLNGHVMDIMRNLGMTSPREFDSVKTEIKRVAHITFGYPADKTGHFFKSESECNTEECGWLIEAAHLLAAELGIVLVESI